jgi:hypothetical protein
VKRLKEEKKKKKEVIGTFNKGKPSRRVVACGDQSFIGQVPNGRDVTASRHE